jgi:AcrR family transcriptional regulator
VRAGVSKRTFYARFNDKPAVFEAVLHRIVESLRPPSNVPLVEGKDIAAILRRLASIILDAAIAPQAIALHRLIVGESARFPKVAAAVNRNAASEEGAAFIAELLKREIQAGRIKLDDPHFAAQHFLQLVITIPQRAAMGLGAPMSEAQLRAWPARVVTLFLEGCRA